MYGRTYVLAALLFAPVSPAHLCVDEVACRSRRAGVCCINLTIAAAAADAHAAAAADRAREAGGSPGSTAVTVGVGG